MRAHEHEYEYVRDQYFQETWWALYACTQCIYVRFEELYERPQVEYLKVPLAPEQETAIQKLDNGKILCGGVGSGKSRTAMAYYMRNEAPKDIYVITTAKKRDTLDWQREAVKYGVGDCPDETVAGVLKVDSWNNIDKYKDVEDAFFIFDEQRVVGRGAWTKSFLKITKHNRWILLSATPGDTWMDYVPVFIANGFFKNRTAFEQEHVNWRRVPHARYSVVDSYRQPGKLIRYKNQLLVDMPYAKHTSRKRYEIRVDYDKECLHTAVVKRWHVYEDRPIKDAAELFGLMRKIVNTDPSRFLAVRELMKKHPKLIIFYNFNYELEILRELAEEGEWQTDSISSSEGVGKNSKTKKMKNATQFEGAQYIQKPESSSLSNSQLLRSSTDDSFLTLGNTQSENGQWIYNLDRTSASMRSINETGLKNTPNSEQRTGDSLSHIRNDSKSPRLSGKSCETHTPRSSSSPTFAIAEWNGQKHEEIPKTDRWVYLVQYTAGAEGWECIDTDAVVFYSLTYSYKNFEQAHGRIDRRNTPFSVLHYYILKSEADIDKSVWRALSAKKSFNEAHLREKLAKAGVRYQE